MITKNLPFYWIKNPNKYWLTIFQKEYERLSGNSIPIEYLENADVYCFFLGPHMVGGFVLNSARNGNSFRYFEIFSYNKELRDILRKLKTICDDVDEKDALEISCVWMWKSLQPLYRKKYYRVLTFETVKSVYQNNYKWVFGGTANPSYIRFVRRFFKNIFYMGILPVDKSDSKILKNVGAGIANIFYVSKKDLKISAIKLLKYLLRSSLRNRYYQLKNKF
jgi:hypothetical protein